MTHFTIHTQETAPAASKPLLDKSLKAFGRVPGLHGVLAEAPKALEAYQNTHYALQRHKPHDHRAACGVAHHQLRK